MNDQVASPQAREPMATRHLTWDDGSGKRDVLVRLWQPAVDGGHFICYFAIDGLDEPLRGEAAGVDSFQALTEGVVGIRTLLANYREKLSWLGQRGDHGIPYYVINIFAADEQRRLEQLVESETERFLEVLSAPVNRWEASLRERYDPNSSDIDFRAVSTEELVERLRAASARECAYRAEGNADAAFVFSQKRWPIITALRNRPEYVAVLRGLSGGNDRALRLLAAQLLFPTETVTLERLRDENVQPEASAADDVLQSIRRSAACPKLWDEPNAPIT